MTHAEMDELYELYVLGALEAAEATEIEQHVETQCAYCLEHVHAAAMVASAMSGMAEPADPPSRLRQRVIASVKLEAPKRSWTFAIAALGVACAGLFAFSLWTAASLRSSRSEIADLQSQRDQLREVVEILSKSDTKTVQFGLANQAHGRVFVNRDRGVVFVGSELPPLAADRTFQLWLVPGSGAPESLGLFRPNAAGNAVRVRTTPIDTGRIQAVAVSVEPPGGSPAPTTKPILIVPLG